MDETPNSYSLDLLRAELGTALANLKIDLIDRFASKSEMAAVQNEVVAVKARQDLHEEQVGNRIGKLESFTNRVAGGLLLAAIVIPIVTTVLVKYVG